MLLPIGVLLNLATKTALTLGPSSWSPASTTDTSSWSVDKTSFPRSLLAAAYVLAYCTSATGQRQFAQSSDNDFGAGWTDFGSGDNPGGFIAEPGGHLAHIWDGHRVRHLPGRERHRSSCQCSGGRCCCRLECFEPYNQDGTDAWPIVLVSCIYVTICRHVLLVS